MAHPMAIDFRLLLLLAHRFSVPPEPMAIKLPGNWEEALMTSEIPERGRGK
jgi:hypothetical protein